MHTILDHDVELPTHQSPQKEMEALDSVRQRIFGGGLRRFRWVPSEHIHLHRRGTDSAAGSK
ncbi:unnamed protein product [Fusarium venenatum]|uniref:Uncharacterized protein n=1 Tax=Fusarium venenatum TaxID=56646 RepID=A0A2L2THM1_9HYPO|nr:uncharacterized protein FVRRES_00409 [Fusarium venenatum]CEI63897.1 unnamed protein product [Fusarium venenatum]